MAVRFAIKSGLVLATVKITRDQGFWGDSDSSVELKSKICKQVSPYIETGKAHLPFAIPQLPETGNIGFLTKHYYNQGVKNTIYFIHRFPCYVGMGFKKIKDTMNSFEQSPEAAKPSPKI